MQSLDAARDDGVAWADKLPDLASADPANKTESSQNFRILLSAVSALPPEQRTAFLLQAEGEFSVEEIAQATAVSFETAKSRLRYARARLKQVLQEQV